MTSYAEGSWEVGVNNGFRGWQTYTLNHRRGLNLRVSFEGRTASWNHGKAICSLLSPCCGDTIVPTHSTGPRLKCGECGRGLSQIQPPLWEHLPLDEEPEAYSVWFQLLDLPLLSCEVEKADFLLTWSIRWSTWIRKELGMEEKGND